MSGTAASKDSVAIEPWSNLDNNSERCVEPTTSPATDLKVCKKCRRVKSIENFSYAVVRGKRYLRHACRACLQIQSRKNGRAKVRRVDGRKSRSEQDSAEWVARNGPFPPCECGCGEQVKYNYMTKGPGRFLNHHVFATPQSREANRLSKKNRQGGNGVPSSQVLAMLQQYRKANGLQWKDMSDRTGLSMNHLRTFFAKKEFYTSLKIVEGMKSRMQGIPTEPSVYQKNVIAKQARRKAGTRPLWGMMIVRNEVDRYLQSVLEHHLNFLDDVFIFDDQSDDETVDLCLSYTQRVAVRPDYIPTFVEHESQFRQWAWDNLLGVSEGDMLLLIDADEFYAPEGDPLVALGALRENMLTEGASSAKFKMPEIWDYQGDDLLIRVDGFWNQNKNMRFAKFRQGTFSAKKMGGGSLPMCYTNNRVYEGPDPILHFGYLDPDDRRAKYQRYSSIAHNGHSARHINSILDNPKLQKWQGVTPRWWRGVVDPSA